jgi:hypothetical protein
MKTRVDYAYAGELGTTTGLFREFEDGVEPTLPDAGDEITLSGGDPTGPFIVVSVRGPFEQSGVRVYILKIRRA